MSVWKRKEMMREKSNKKKRRKEKRRGAKLIPVRREESEEVIHSDCTTRRSGQGRDVDHDGQGREGRESKK